MSKKIVLLTLVLTLLLSAMVVTSSAQTRTVGVNVGDWIKFGDINVTWSSNDPNATKIWYGMDLERYNETEWGKGQIMQVSGTNVTIQYTERFKDSTEETSSVWIDIDTGDGNATLMIISANLNENDALYTSGDYSTYLINETITRVYPDTTRETNHINMTYGPYNYTIPPDTEVYFFYSMNFYWDRATGILVEDSFEMTNQTGEYLTTWSIDFKITESSVWVVPEFPSLTSILLILVVLTTAIVIYTQSNKQRKRHNARAAAGFCQNMQTSGLLSIRRKSWTSTMN